MGTTVGSDYSHTTKSSRRNLSHRLPENGEREDVRRAHHQLNLFHAPETTLTFL